MSWNTLLLEKQNGVAVLTINRPSVLNALNKEVFVDLDDCLTKIAVDPEIAVLVITGAGDRSFIAGADISYMQNMGPVESLEWGMFGQKIVDMIEALPQPVIAAINGFALGGGNELAMGCDMRFASEKAKFGQPEPGLGVTPGFGGTQRLPRLIGLGRANYLLHSGNVIDSRTALEWGLVDMVFPHEELLAKVMEIAEKIARHPRTAVRQIKQCVLHGLEAPKHSGLNLEAQAFAVCFATEEQKEKMKAFLDKSKK